MKRGKYEEPTLTVPSKKTESNAASTSPKKFESARNSLSGAKSRNFRLYHRRSTSTQHDGDSAKSDAPSRIIPKKDYTNLDEFFLEPIKEAIKNPKT